MENKTYILNKETQKIELHFSKSEYQALTDEQKKELKSSYLFSGKVQAWVSRSINNHYSAIQVAKKLGFVDGGSIGERLSYGDQVQKQVDKAEARAERYEGYSGNAAKRGENLQSDLNKMHGDIAFFTQPNINTAKGRSFTNYRDRLFNRYNKGFEEYRKSEYFMEKARTAEETASMSKFKDKTYLDNRIKECNKNIKAYEKNVAYYEDIIYKKQNNISIENSFVNGKTIEDYQGYLQNALEKMEYEMDKLAYLENCLDEIGGIKYSQENIKTDYLTKIRGTWYKIIKANKTTIEGIIVEGGAKGMVLKHSYAEIQEVKIPDDYKEPKNEIENPYNVGDILVHYAISSNRVITAYQVLKTTAKGVQLQKINISNNTPIKDDFTLDKPLRKGIIKSKYSDFVGCYDGDWQLNKYIAQ